MLLSSRTTLAALGLLLVVLAMFALTTGRVAVSPGDLVGTLAGTVFGDSVGNPDAALVLFELRGPRVLAAIVAGAALSMSGAAFQTVFRNPLVSPDILGVSSGAACGAAAAILLGLGPASIQALAFAGGIVAVVLVYAIGVRLRRHDPLLALVLTGVVVGSLFASILALAKYLADPRGELPAITFWLLGSFAAIEPAEIAYALPLAIAGLAPVVLLRWRINLLALPDDEARALGIDVGRTRAIVIAGATLAAAAIVAVSGVIGWIGLLVPHAARLAAGPDFARQIPLAALLGAVFLLVVDTLCRTVTSAELPPGVLTALVGTPAFLWLFATSRGARA